MSLEKVYGTIQYTPEQWAVIDKITHVDLFGVSIPIGDKTRLTTREGISEQLNSFTGPVGLIHYFSFEFYPEGDISSAAIDLHDHPEYYEAYKKRAILQMIEKL